MPKLISIASLDPNELLEVKSFEEIKFSEQPEDLSEDSSYNLFTADPKKRVSFVVKTFD